MGVHAGFVFYVSAHAQLTFQRDVFLVKKWTT